MKFEKSLFTKRKDGKVSSQEMFISYGFGKDYIKDLSYIGPRGAAKSHTAMLDAILTIIFFSNHNVNAIVFRRRHNALDLLIDTAVKIVSTLLKEYSPSNKTGLTYKNNKEKGKRRLDFYKDGKLTSKLNFRTITSVKDYEDNYHGHEYQWICFDEMSTWPNMDLYHLMGSCLRYSDPNGKTEELPLKMRSTTNPWGIGIVPYLNHYTKDKKGDNVEYGQIQEDVVKLMNGATVKSRKCLIFGSWVENNFLNDGYIQSIAQSAKNDIKKRDAYLYGTINFEEGGFFTDLLEEVSITVKPFTIPEAWRRDAFISYDDGTTSPFSALFCVRAKTGSYINHNGQEIKIPKNSLFIIDEIYGSPDYFKATSSYDIDDPARYDLSAIDLSIGANYTHSKIAEIINERNSTYIRGLLQGRVAECGPADTSIKKNDRGVGGQTVADIFKHNGLVWKDAAKAKGSRKDGASVLRNMLQATLDNDPTQPHIYFFSGRTRFLMHNLQNLKRDPNNPDDILDENKDHDYDALRYAISYKKTGGFTLYK